MKRYNLAANVSFAFVSEVLTRGGLVLSAVYLANALGNEAFGLFAAAQAFACTLAILVEAVGSSSYAARLAASQGDDLSGVVSEIVTLRGAAALVIVATCALGLTMTSPGDKLRIYIICAMFYIIPCALYVDWCFRGLGRNEFIALGSLLGIAVYWGGLVLAVRTPKDVVPALLLWSCVYGVGAAVLLFTLVRRFSIRFRPCFDRVKLSTHLKASLTFAFAGVFGSLLTQVPMLVMGAVGTPHDTSIFAAPYRLVMAVASLGQMVVWACYPALVGLREDDEAFRGIGLSLQKMMLFLALPMAVSGLVLAGPVINFVYGPAYRESVSSFQILVLLIPIYYIITLFEFMLMAKGMERDRLRAYVGAVIAIATLSPVFILSWGAVGAALALLVSLAVLMVNLTLLLLRAGHLWFPFRDVAKIAAASLGMGMLLWFIPKEVPILVQMVIGLFANTLMVLGLGAISLQGVVAHVRSSRGV
jgi:O-antigen/teichoic acid export membrane protein